MKVILIGYPGSQMIVPASKYLVSKYLTYYDEFNAIYLNYKGDTKGWSQYVAGFLEYLTDENIIFALDDYLLADRLTSAYYKAVKSMDGEVVCVKLCYSTPEEHAEYPVTTQYCIWNREYLISLLRKVNTPWEFEINGSRLFDKKVVHVPCLEYFTNSSISARWKGVRLDGLKQEDVNYLLDNLLPKSL